MPGLDPGIHGLSWLYWKTWMAGSSPAMTNTDTTFLRDPLDRALLHFSLDGFPVPDIISTLIGNYSGLACRNAEHCLDNMVMMGMGSPERDTLF
jgi:hypothetical protein